LLLLPLFFLLLEDVEKMRGRLGHRKNRSCGRVGRDARRAVRLGDGRMAARDFGDATAGDGRSWGVAYWRVWGS